MTNEAMTMQNLLDEEHGMLLAATAVRAGLSRSCLSRMVQSGLLERVERGAYVRAGELGDEMYMLQQRAQKIVYSHDTALFLHGLTDRTPSYYVITVPSAYKPSDALKSRCKIYYVKPEWIDLGKAALSTGMEHEVTSYNRERTICDVVRSRNKMDRQIVAEALKNYAAGKPNLNLLAEYSEHFGVRKILSQYLEVLL